VLSVHRLPDASAERVVLLAVDKLGLVQMCDVL
jgi:hypothetical protein